MRDLLKKVFDVIGFLVVGVLVIWQRYSCKHKTGSRLIASSDMRVCCKCDSKVAKK